MIDSGQLIALAFGGINAVSIGLFTLYVKGTRSDIGEVKQRMTELSNGCFARHAKLERELGQREMETKAIHRRLDDRD